MTLVDVCVTRCFDVEGVRRAEREGLFASGQKGDAGIVVVVRRHHSAVAVEEHAAVAVRSDQSTAVASGDQEGPCFWIVIHVGCGKFCIDECLGFEPCSQQRRICWQGEVEQVSREHLWLSLLWVDAVLYAVQVPLVSVVQHGA